MEQLICKFCGKAIIGYTTKQVEHLLYSHIISKHEKELFKEKEKGTTKSQCT